jgi:hypothetical protein
MAKFQGNIANLRIYDKALSLDEIKRDAQADQAISAKFETANPIEFSLYNQQDERAIYITDSDTPLHPFILELRNTSPRDIILQMPETEDGWTTWQAGKDQYHLQLRFRPGTLSDMTKAWFKKPALRLAALKQGWDIQYDPDEKDLVDWISLLWVGKERGLALVESVQNAQSTSPSKFRLKGILGSFEKNGGFDLQACQQDLAKITQDLKAVFQSFSVNQGMTLTASGDSSGQQNEKDIASTPTLARNSTYKLVLPHLTAGAAGGARGTRVYLSHKNLKYASSPGLLEKIPDGSRTQYINILNHQGKEYIPLHVGIVGSNTILNDGETSNELKLRLTNISRSNSIKFEQKAATQATKFTITFDLEKEGEEKKWALTKTSLAQSINVKLSFKQDNQEHQVEFDSLNQATKKKLSSGTELNQALSLSNRSSISTWEATLNFQGEQLSWSFTYTGSEPQILNPGEYIDLDFSEIKSASPAGMTNLYLNYEDIPGYWDGRFVCLIEKSPLVYRRQHDEQNKEIAGSDWCVGIGTDTPQAKLHVNQEQNGKPAAIFQGGNFGIGIDIPEEKLHVNGGLRVDGSIKSQSLSVGDSNSNNHISSDGALYRTGDNVYLTVDNNFYIRDTQSGKQFHFDTNTAKFTSESIELTKSLSAESIELMRSLSAESLNVSNFKRDTGQHINDDGVIYRYGTGEVYLTVDNYFYIRGTDQEDDSENNILFQPGYGKLSLKDISLSSKPIIIKRYKSRSDGTSGLGDNIEHRTGFRVSDYTAAIVGFSALNGDINENDAVNIIRLYMYTADGYWHIRADFASHKNSENWYVDVMFVSKNISRNEGDWARYA